MAFRHCVVQNVHRNDDKFWEECFSVCSVLLEYCGGLFDLLKAALAGSCESVCRLPYFVNHGKQLTEIKRVAFELVNLCVLLNPNCLLHFNRQTLQIITVEILCKI